MPLYQSVISAVIKQRSKSSRFNGNIVETDASSRCRDNSSVDCNDFAIESRRFTPITADRFYWYDNVLFSHSARTCRTVNETEIKINIF